jgi:hypothetical protein
MPLVRTHVLGMCALLAPLALPAVAVAQTPRAPTVFSPSAQMGTVNVRAALVLSDYSVKPLPLLKLVAKRVDRPDSVAVQTDLDGRVAIPLKVGTYMVRANTPQPVGGRSYAWAVRVVVRPSRSELIQLSNANADSSDVTSSIVASAPASTSPAPMAAPAAVKSVAQKPVEDPFSLPPATTPKRVAVVDTTTFVTPAPASAPVAAPPRAQVPKPAPTPLTTPAVARSSQNTMPRANTSKLILGLGLNGSSISSEDLTTSTESGAGLSGQLGWGFTKNFALVLDASAARIESLDGNFDLAHVDVSGRWHFVSKSHGFVPYVEVGYSGRAAGKQDVLLSDDMGNVYTGDLAILGGGVSLGGGMEYFIASTWALGGSFKWTTGQFNQVRFDNVTIDGLALDATSARFNLGFSWYPMRPAR